MNEREELERLLGNARVRWGRNGYRGEPEDYLTDTERRRQAELEAELERQEAEAIEEAKQRGWPI